MEAYRAAKPGALGGRYVRPSQLRSPFAKDPSGRVSANEQAFEHLVAGHQFDSWFLFDNEGYQTKLVASG
jgi:hypothetical protein